MDEQNVPVTEHTLDIFQESLLSLLRRFDRENMDQKQNCDYTLDINICFDNLGEI